jgi:predicted 2-oxoglutarate/Fe(II)-dependent dioxygenase YbiX
LLVQIENALGPEDCRELMTLYDRCAGHAAGSDVTGHPVVYANDVPEPELALVRRVADQGRRLAAAALAPGEPIFTETAILAAIGVGGSHPRHADNRRQDDDGRWVPNHTPHRALSALYYLNDGFEGGELVFETVGAIVKPRAGLFVAFPSDERFVHEVPPVTSGRRYSVALWFTRQPEHALAGFRAG